MLWSPSPPCLPPQAVGMGSIGGIGLYLGALSCCICTMSAGSTLLRRSLDLLGGSERNWGILIVQGTESPVRSYGRICARGRRRVRPLEPS